MPAPGITQTRIKTAEPRAKTPPVDLYGNPLPRGTIARLGTVRLWHPEGITSAVFSRDGKTLISAGEATRWPRSWQDAYSQKGIQLRIWDMKSGSLLGQLGPMRMSGALRTGLSPFALPPNIGGLSYSSQKNVVAVASQNTVDVWDLIKGKPLGQIHNEGDDFSLQWIALSPDAKTVASCSEHIQLWDVRSGKRLRRIPREEEAPQARAAAFSPDSKLLAGCFTDRTVRLYDPPTAREIRRIEKARAKAAVFSPNGKLLAAGGLLPSSSDNDEDVIEIITLWEMPSGKKYRAFPAGKDRFCSFAFSPDDRILVAGTHDGMVHLWDIKSGTKRHSFHTGYDPVEWVSLTPSGSTVAMSDGQSIRLWDCHRQAATPFPGTGWLGWLPRFSAQWPAAGFGRRGRHRPALASSYGQALAENPGEQPPHLGHCLSCG
jgi:WD40 repeat protein